MNARDMVKASMVNMVPFARELGVELTEVGDGSAAGKLALNDGIKNHIGTMHAGAMFTLGETVSGGASSGAFAEQLMGIRPLAAQATIRYMKVAKGDLTATARTSDSGDVLRDRLAADGKVMFTVSVAIMDETGEEVAAMSVDWSVKKL